ncbi:HK97 family phage prohead protease [Clostridium sp. LQ25]|uniref:HK97 family phage prohead protease n=1 Tax=Clostridium sp. LQ25 TaxID=2992805 RepID=UPI00224CE071|nr:HK97 family phage prohead protease [Clostridium sp. LQ25]UZT06633.1 HK97 family phage prohead protease [Clostridium sp. LQ25]
MEVIKDNFKHIWNFVKREIEEFNLLEISILDVTPAYNHTFVEARNLYIPINLDIDRKRLELYKLI